MLVWESLLFSSAFCSVQSRLDVIRAEEMGKARECGR